MTQPGHTFAGHNISGHYKQNARNYIHSLIESL